MGHARCDGLDGAHARHIHRVARNRAGVAGQQSSVARHVGVCQVSQHVTQHHVLHLIHWYTRPVVKLPA